MYKCYTDRHFFFNTKNLKSWKSKTRKENFWAADRPSKLQTMKTLAFALSLGSCAAAATGTTGGATGAEAGFPLADIHDSESPTRVVLDTLGTIDTDATRDISLTTSYQSVSSLCNGTLAHYREQISLDTSAAKKKHNALTFDVHRITKSMEAVNRLENKLVAAKHSAKRSNRTLFDLSNIRELQKGYFQSHSIFLNEVHTDLQGLHKFLDAPPGHLSKHADLSSFSTSSSSSSSASSESASSSTTTTPTAPDVDVSPPVSLLQLSRTLQQQQQEHMQQTHRLRHVQQAMLRSSAVNPGSPVHSVRVNKITDVTPEPLSFHEQFHTTLEDLQSFLTNATSEHTTSQAESHEEYTKAYDTMYTEAALQRGKLTQLKNALEQARAEHRAAVTIMNNLKVNGVDRTKSFNSKNTKSALSSLERQCELMEQAQELRAKHRQLDVDMSRKTKKLMIDIVEEMNSGGVTGGTGGTGMTGAGPTGGSF